MDVDAVRAVWQIVVGQDEIGRLDRGFRPFQRGRAVTRRRGEVSFLIEKGLQVLADFGVILDNQNAPLKDRRFGRALGIRSGLHMRLRQLCRR